MEKIKPGYAGKDAMRSKAEKMLGPHGFADGGMVDGMKRGGKTTHSRRSSFHKKELSGLEKVKRDIHEEGTYKRGGHAHHKHHKAYGGEMHECHGGPMMKKGGKAHHKHHHGLNHDQADLHLPKKKSHTDLSIQNAKEVENMKHGGHSKHHHKKHHHYDEGGQILSGVTRMRPLPPFVTREGTNMKKGGKAHHHKHHKAEGGGIYEREMVGEHPSHKRPHINYESDMRGEKIVRKAMAMGGVGKIRHKEATKEGAPLHKRKIRG